MEEDDTINFLYQRQKLSNKEESTDTENNELINEEEFDSTDEDDEEEFESSNEESSDNEETYNTIPMDTYECYIEKIIGFKYKLQVPYWCTKDNYMDKWAIIRSKKCNSIFKEEKIESSYINDEPLYLVFKHENDTSDYKFSRELLIEDAEQEFNEKNINVEQTEVFSTHIYNVDSNTYGVRTNATIATNGIITAMGFRKSEKIKLD